MGIYLTIIILLRIPSIQDACGQQVASLLSKRLGTEVKVERIDIGFLNRIIIDGLYVTDQQGKPMLQASRFSVKLDLIPLTRGEISISSAQLFGMQANLYKNSKNAKPNFQFVIDSLASKDTTTQAKPIRIASIVLRRGSVKYEQLDIPQTKHFSPAHLYLKDISAHVIVSELSKDSLNVKLKNLSFKERSGLQVKSFSSKLRANTNHAVLENFKLELPNSKLVLHQVRANYRMRDGAPYMPSLSYHGLIDNSHVTPSDLAFISPKLGRYHTPVSIQASLSGTASSLTIHHIHSLAKNELELTAKATIQRWTKSPKWNLDVETLNLQQAAVRKYLPKEYQNTPLAEFRHIRLSGNFHGEGKDIHAKGILSSNLGDIKFDATAAQGSYKGMLETNGLKLAPLLSNHDFGLLTAKIQLNEFREQGSQAVFNIKGDVPKIEYKGYPYKNVSINGRGSLDAHSRLDHFEGTAALNDPNGVLNIQGKVNRSQARYAALFDLTAKDVNLSALHLTQKWPNRMVSLQASSQLSGRSLKDVTGRMTLADVTMRGPNQTYSLSRLELKTGYDQRQEHFISLDGDFGNALVVGTFDYTSILQNIENIIIDKLPGIQLLTPMTRRVTPRTNIRLYADISKTDWANYLFDIPLSLQQPLQLSGTINSVNNQLNINVDAPDLTYDGSRYQDNHLHLSTPADTLHFSAEANKLDAENKRWTWRVRSSAANDHLLTTLWFNNHAAHPFQGTLNTTTRFFKKNNGETAAHVIIHPSEILIEDSIWNIEPSDIMYSRNHLTVDHFAIHHDDQHVIVAGLATKNPTDTLAFDLKGIDVNYVLNLLQFDAVTFGGRLSGRACASGIFGKPQGHANVQVSPFEFETGQMGVLDANVSWNAPLRQIDIQALASDQGRQTLINGFVSPSKHYIDLAIQARQTRLQFLEGFCGSFMQDVDASGTGLLRLYGDLSYLNLTGQVVADGSMGITPLNTHYTLRRDTITLKPDEIIFKNDTVYDRNENIGIVNGRLSHDNLTNLRYDLHVAAESLLAYDTHAFDGNTFYGTAYVNGTCAITGNGDDLNIDVNAIPQKGSQIVYNVAGLDAVSNQNFIRWSTRNDSLQPDSAAPRRHSNDLGAQKLPEVSGDLHLNLLINSTPNLTLKLLMDNKTGDYIALNGNGVLRANYYDKGPFEMFGNYTVDHGVYALTIQNVIKKNFQFQQGSAITFGGDPFHAALNLNATHTVNGVSLADLNIGRSFTNNNVRVNCLMNITGTPQAPRVDFNLDMPTLSNDAKQMVYSLINSEEEMNQQVLYLLAVGRFYSQGANNSAATEGAAQHSQASLAMQSILSGTLSQQINNVLNTVIDNADWNIGANISTGTEGFNNAEYEGLLSGRLLNNRLLINGQFGYRDNPNAATSFIGDFDLRYLLVPNGNLAVKVYNLTNDRYFTRNSLTTQGLGLILKKDFTNLKDLFGRRRAGKAETSR